MKKLTAILLALTLLLTFAACGGGDSQEENNKPPVKMNDLNSSQSNSFENTTTPPVNQQTTPDIPNESNAPNASVNFDKIKFGGYDWFILDVQDGKALILSEVILTRRVYHSDNVAITWAECEIREYLNGDFIDDTFTSDEKAKISEVMNENEPNPQSNTKGGIQTEDKVFLLSIDEASEYFKDDAERVAYDENNEVWWWWLRSPGGDANTVTSVIKSGLVYLHGLRVNSDYEGGGGVRPAMWITVE